MAIPAGFNPPDNLDADPLVDVVLRPGPCVPEGVTITIGNRWPCVAGEPFKLRLSEAKRLVAGVAALEFVNPPPPSEAVESEPEKKVRRKG